MRKKKKEKGVDFGHPTLHNGIMEFGKCTANNKNHVGFCPCGCFRFGLPACRNKGRLIRPDGTVGRMVMDIDVWRFLIDPDARFEVA